MLLDIDPAVFQSEEHMTVVKLLAMVARGQHDWRPSLKTALNAEQFVDGHSLRAPALKELVRKSLEESANAVRANPATVAVTAAELVAIVEDLEKPAVVVVEDGINEGSFLLALATAFGQHRIVDAVRRHWLRISHAGGKDRMAKFVEWEREHFHIVIRVVALLDSDRKLPDPRTGNHDKVDRIRAVDGVREVHMWAWCEIENYVPTRVWEHHFPELDVKIDTLRTMIPRQRGYLDMKKGLDASDPQLFGNLPSDARTEWQVGFPKLKGRELVPGDVALTRADFEELGPDAVTELEGLLAMINRIL